MSMPSTDRFRNLYSDVGPLDGPLTRAVAVTPSDTVDLAWIPRAIMVGVAGDVVVDLVEGGTTIVLKNVPAGIPLWIRPSRIRATNTTATNIVALD